MLRSQGSVLLWCGLTAVLVLGVPTLAGCPGQTQDQPTKRGPRGPRIRLVASEDRTPARLVLEVDPRRRPVGPATLHTFNFTIEESVSAADGDTAVVKVRFNEVVGASGEPALTDQLALAMDDLKISFRRSARGEVSDLKIGGLRPPLDEPTAHAIVFTLFAAGRGPRLPDHSVAAQDDWTVEADAELVGLTAHQRYFYTLIGQTGPNLEFREKGHVEGIATISGSRRKVNGDTFTTETLDLERGVVVSGEYEWNATVEEEPSTGAEIPGLGRTHIRAERGRAVPTKKRR